MGVLNRTDRRRVFWGIRGLDVAGEKWFVHHDLPLIRSGPFRFGSTLNGVWP